MFMDGCFFVRSQLVLEHAHLVIVKFDLEMLWVCLDRILSFSGNCCHAQQRCKQHEFLFDPGTDLARRARQRRADISFQSVFLRATDRVVVRPWNGMKRRNDRYR
jgi:hypothetical protein